MSEKSLSCKCGCGRTPSRWSKSGYVAGHHNRSSEARARMSGSKNPFYGKQHPPDVMERIRQKNIEKPGWNKGIPMREETKKKLSASQKGCIKWPNGRKFDESFGDKISRGKTGKPWSEKQREAMEGRWVRHPHPMTGRSHSEETKEKMSKSKVSLITQGKFNPYNKDIGGFWSEKNKKTIHYRSGLELMAFKILETLRKVSSYEVEPFSIEYEFDGRVRRYIPDLLVRYTDGSMELIEIKPDAMINLPINLAKAVAAEKYCQLNGMKFSIWSRRNLA